MAKETKFTYSKLEPKPFELMGFTVEEYVGWCVRHGKPSYAQSTKREFFALVRAHKIVKRNGKVIEYPKEGK